MGEAEGDTADTIPDLGKLSGRQTQSGEHQAGWNKNHHQGTAVHHGSTAEATVSSLGWPHARGLRLNTKSSTQSHIT